MNSSINTIIFGAYAHTWLRDFCTDQASPISLAQIPDEPLNQLQDWGVNWFWLIGAWQSGPYGRRHAISHPDLRRACQNILPDMALPDMVGSPYAIQDYHIHRALGGDQALQVFREKLARRGIRLMLDYVPNHTACDHRWVAEHPDFYIAGDFKSLDEKSGFFTETNHSDAILMYGKDPNFGPWTDTAQVDWRNPRLVTAMAQEISRIATMCDGLRCDMAMLILQDVFQRTWGAGPYARSDIEPWTVLVQAARKLNPKFLFLAEVYWGMEERLINLGFDWTYDKVLYDRLRYGDVQELRLHLNGSKSINHRLLRFLENHDECRAASAFACDRHEAAAVIATTLPGPFFLHGGQVEGRRIKLPIQLGRAPKEIPDNRINTFYQKLLKGIRMEGAQWCGLECHPAWEGSATFSGMMANGWCNHQEGLIAIVNFSPDPGHCYLDLSKFPLPQDQVKLTDVLQGTTYIRNTQELRLSGLYVDLPAWGAHLFRFPVQ